MQKTPLCGIMYLRQYTHNHTEEFLCTMDYITHVDLCQPLKDTNDYGRDRPWAQHRNNADLLAEVYTTIDQSKAVRVQGCAPRLLFKLDEAAHMHLETAWFCRVRLCPVCQWRRALKIYGQTCQIIQHVQQQHPNTHFIMLTLTCRNVQADKLSACITEMVEGWHRMLKRKVWTDAITGAQRNMEITHNMNTNSKAYGTYHPHFHVILACKPNYFHRGYISQAAWIQLWKECIRAEYDPSVEVHKVRGDVLTAAKEITKYTTKPGDYIIPDDVDMMINTVKTLDKALHHRRLVAWCGVMKEAQRALHLDDVEAGDLVHTDDAAANVDDEQAARVAFAWLKSHRQYYKELDSQ